MKLSKVVYYVCTFVQKSKLNAACVLNCVCTYRDVLNLRFIEEGQSGVQRVRENLVAACAAADVKVEGDAVLGVKMTVDVGERHWVLKPGHARRSVVLRH